MSYVFASKYESFERLTIKCVTTINSFGRIMLERIQEEVPVLENNRYCYYFGQAPICELLSEFITKLRSFSDRDRINLVLENITFTQTLYDMKTKEVLMCLCGILAIGSGTYGPQFSVYRLLDR
jgi:hypothetical protein